MKNLTLLFLLAFPQFLHAQEDHISRPWVLGGSFSFTSQNDGFPTSFLDLPNGLGGIISTSSGNTNSTFFRVSPYIGRQLSDHWMAGIDLNYLFLQYRADDVISFPQQTTYDFKRNSNQYGISLFARYSFLPDSRFDFFLQPYAQYSFAREESFVDGNPDDEETANYIQLGSDIGVLYNINDRWRVILRMGGLRYVTGQWKNDDTSEENDFSAFGLNMSLESIGIGVEMKM